MRGQLLGVDRDTGEGQVAGDDGRRYRFRPADWAGRGDPAIGQRVDFGVDQDRAVSLFPLPGDARGAARRSPRDPAIKAARGMRGRDKLLAALLAFCLGAFGVHRFYVGRVGSGIAMLALSLSVVGLVASILWALADTLRFLFMSNREFDARYN